MYLYFFKYLIGDCCSMARTTKMRRKDLIQPDHFISTTDVIIAYCTEHKTKIVFSIGSIFLIFFSGLWFKHNRNLNTLKMESLYFKLEQIKSSKLGGSKEKIKQMNTLLLQFSKGPQKQRALLALADEYFNEGSYDKAIKQYRNILAESSSSLNQQLATIGIAYSLEGKKDYKGAIVAYKTIIESHNEYPLFHVYLRLARCYELNNNQSEALLTLREMKIRFSNHPKLELAESRLKKLET